MNTVEFMYNNYLWYQWLTPFRSLTQEIYELWSPILDGLSHGIVYHLHVHVVGEDDVEVCATGPQRLPLARHVLDKTLLHYCSVVVRESSK